MRDDRLVLIDELLWDHAFGPTAGVYAEPIAAGAVHAAAVILDYTKDCIRVAGDDGAWYREQLALAFLGVTRKARAWAVGSATSRESYERGMAWAIDQAMQRAIRALPLVPRSLLVDGRHLSGPGMPSPQFACAEAERWYRCVAAARIVARWTRYDETILRRTVGAAVVAR